MELTAHAQIRQQQRGISDSVFDIISNNGRVSYAPGGAMKIFFGKKEYTTAVHEIKKMLKLLDRAKGGTLIVADDKVVTVYRNNQ